MRLLARTSYRTSVYSLDRTWQGIPNWDRRNDLWSGYPHPLVGAQRTEGATRRRGRFRLAPSRVVGKLAQARFRRFDVFDERCPVALLRRITANSLAQIMIKNLADQMQNARLAAHPLGRRIILMTLLTLFLKSLGHFIISLVFSKKLLLWLSLAP